MITETFASLLYDPMVSRSHVLYDVRRVGRCSILSIIFNSFSRAVKYKRWNSNSRFL
jgi:hypothetical protein